MSPDASESNMFTDKKKTERPANEIPFHGATPHARPADAFMAEQAAVVAPRREAFARLALAPEHVEQLPDELKQALRPDAEPKAPGVAFDAAVERPVLEFELPTLERKAKKSEEKED